MNEHSRHQGAVSLWDAFCDALWDVFVGESFGEFSSCEALGDQSAEVWKNEHKSM